MITAITIENFKGISEPVRLELRPITLLFGQNSAGKSSLLHAMIYAREVFERQYLMAQIERFGGNISKTAEFVGMERSALHRKIKSLGL